MHAVQPFLEKIQMQRLCGIFNEALCQFPPIMVTPEAPWRVKVGKYRWGTGLNEMYQFSVPVLRNISLEDEIDHEKYKTRGEMNVKVPSFGKTNFRYLPGVLTAQFS